MTKKTSSMQKYPREQDSDFLDISQLKPHEHKLSLEELKSIILRAIEIAQHKARREIVDLSEDASEDDILKTYQKGGRELFVYFKSYFTDPASSAYQYQNKHYSDVAKEQFRSRIIQKERMNSAWRYQYIAIDIASKTGRFKTIADLALSQADFCAVVPYIDTEKTRYSELAVFVSVKNRTNTIPGAQWPKTISALEDVAKTDKNRVGDYICVFGITIERGQRKIKRAGRTGMAHSPNTEIWLADFFWPFFANYTYEEIMKAVLDVLIETQKPTLQENIPTEIIESFGNHCREHGLLDENGFFNNPHRLVELFCRSSQDFEKH